MPNQHEHPDVCACGLELDADGRCAFCERFREAITGPSLGHESGSSNRKTRPRERVDKEAVRQAVHESNQGREVAVRDVF